MFWANMQEDIKHFVGCCVNCIESQPNHPIKLSKIIVPTWPLDRLIIDLVELNHSMRTFLPENKQYKYVLTTVDHFSKYKWAYL